MFETNNLYIVKFQFTQFCLRVNTEKEGNHLPAAVLDLTTLVISGQCLYHCVADLNI